MVWFRIYKGLGMYKTNLPTLLYGPLIWGVHHRPLYSAIHHGSLIYGFFRVLKFLAQTPLTAALTLDWWSQRTICGEAEWVESDQATFGFLSYVLWPSEVAICDLLLV